MAVPLLVASCTPGGEPSPTQGAEPIPASFKLDTRSFRLQHTTSLRSPILGITFRGKSDGYAADGNGRVRRFRIDRDGRFTSRIVARGFSQPRDVLFFDNKLFVTDATFPCKKRTPGFGIVRCRREEMAGHGGLTRLLRESKGRVVTFDVAPDGSLANRRVIVDDLPVASSDHAVNGLAGGPDGRVYMSIGGVDPIAEYDLLDKIDRKNLDLLGTVVRFLPDGSDLQVYVRGIRNVYHLLWADGALYGVDNDGETFHGWRFEELVRFREGANYAYPQEGTLGPHEIRTDPPVWIVNAQGSAGIEWGPYAGLPPGVVVASCSKVTFLEFFSGKPVKRQDVRDLLELDACVPVVKATPDHRLLVSTLGPHRLLVYSRAPAATATPR